MSVLERFDKENCSCFPWDFNDFPHWRLTTGLLRSVGRPVIGLGIHQSVRFSPPLNDFQHHSNPTLPYLIWNRLKGGHRSGGKRLLFC